MEALIVALFALAAIVLVDAGYWIALSLMRWTPIIAVGGLAAWFTGEHGAHALEALAIGAVTSLLARHLLRRRYFYDADDCL